jgi:hypothetical protein
MPPGESIPFPDVFIRPSAIISVNLFLPSVDWQESMMAMSDIFRPALSITSIGLNVLVAVPLMGLGALTLISPDVPPEALTENTYVGLTLLIASLVLFYDLFRPISGGLLILVLVLPFSIMFNAFHASELLMKSRVVGYDSFWTVAAIVLVILAGLSIVRGRLASSKGASMTT